tara:strand:- start:31111 stop:31863 length:753 start_codon:yes stop_codon:yes gene_type:complete
MKLKVKFTMNNKFKIILTHPGDISDFSSISNDLEVFHFPTIKIKSHVNEMLNIDHYDFLLFSSKYAASVFLQSKGVNFSNINALCVGVKAKDILKKNGVNISFYSNSYKEKFIEEIKSFKLINGKKTLYISGNLSDSSIEESLQTICEINRLDIYETLEIYNKYNQFEDLLVSNKCIVVFTSPSAFKYFYKKYKTENIIIATIGKTTSNYIKKLNFKVDITSSKQSYDSLSNEINNYVKKQNLKYDISSN